MINVTIEKRDTKLQYQINYSEGFKISRDFLRIHDGVTVMDAEGLIAQNIEAVRRTESSPASKESNFHLAFVIETNP